MRIVAMKGSCGIAAGAGKVYDAIVAEIASISGLSITLMNFSTSSAVNEFLVVFFGTLTKIFFATFLFRYSISTK